MTPGLLLRDVELDGRRADVRVQGGRVTAIDDDLSSDRGGHVLDASGGALLPGLHDHHIHLLALAAAARSVDVGHDLPAALRAADASSPPGSWLRAIGYDERSDAVPLDRWTLDSLVSGRPVRVQHRSGALWVLNSAAVEATGLDDVGSAPGVERDERGVANGRLWRLDRWLRDRLPGEPLDLDGAGERLLRRGVTGVTDATPAEDASSIALLGDAATTGALRQRVVVTGGPGLDPAACPELSRGPVKLLMPDHEPPDVDALVAGVRAARRMGRAVAVHCVTRVAAVVAVMAIEEVGPYDGDRIEHGAVLPLEVARRLADLGVTVVTNPGFVAERGDRYLAEVEEADLSDLWRCRSLVDAGVQVGAGTDAPFGAPDPWAAMAASVDRRAQSGTVIGGDEAVAPAAALAMFLSPLDRPGGPPRTVTVGAPADLCLLAAPLSVVFDDFRAVEVVATVVGGELTQW